MHLEHFQRAKVFSAFLPLPLSPTPHPPSAIASLHHKWQQGKDLDKDASQLLLLVLIASTSCLLPLVSVPALPLLLSFHHPTPSIDRGRGRGHRLSDLTEHAEWYFNIFKTRLANGARKMPSPLFRFDFDLPLFPYSLHFWAAASQFLPCFAACAASLSLAPAEPAMP